MAIVYLISNNKNGKRYIGVTTRTLEQRWRCHVGESKRSNYRLHNAIRKYGPEAFTIEEVYQNPDNEFILKIAERHFIEEYESHVSTGKGYNMTWGGDGIWGYKFSNDSKKKMRQAKIGRKLPQKHIHNMVESRRGYTHSTKTKEKIREAKLGKTRKPSTRKTIKTSNQKYTYTIQTPDGKITTTENLKDFALENGLSATSLYPVAQGKRKQAKGFKVLNKERKNL